VSSPGSIADVDAILLPVDGSAPAGPNLKYQPVFDEIKAARRLAEADPAELAPWKKVAELVVKATSRSKDLQLAIWLLEAFARIDGFRGTSTGLVVVRRLLQDFWESVHPQLDLEDPDPVGYRRALLYWLDDRLPQILKATPLTGPPSFYGLVHYEVTQKTGDEKKALLDEGWPSYEKFDESLQATTTAALDGALADLLACEAELAALQAVVDQRFNGVAAGQERVEPIKFVAVREVFETARWLIERPLKKRRSDDAPKPSAVQTSAGGSAVTASVDTMAAPGTGLNGDQLWMEALTFTRGSRVDGLQLMQAQLAAATCGRDRFLRQLQLAELSLEAGVYSLAYPVFDELVRVIDARQLEEWEDKALIARVLRGLARCCGLLKAQNSAAVTRETEILDRLARIASA
jgi:type VI secretion system protein ImpA